jgi:hypothetical protein
MVKGVNVAREYLLQQPWLRYMREHGTHGIYVDTQSSYRDAHVTTTANTFFMKNLKKPVGNGRLPTLLGNSQNERPTQLQIGKLVLGENIDRYHLR